MCDECSSKKVNSNHVIDSTFQVIIMRVYAFIKPIVILLSIILSPFTFAQYSHVVTISPIKNLNTYQSYVFSSSDSGNVILAHPKNEKGYKQILNHNSVTELLGVNSQWHQMTFSPNVEGKVFTIRGDKDKYDLVQSKDDGLTWKDIKTTCPLRSAGNSWSKIQFVPGKPDTVIFSQNTQGLFVSNDNGQTCNKVSKLPATNLNVFVSSDGFNLYAIDWHSLNVYHSNESLTWDLLTKVKADYRCEPFAIGINDSNLGYFFNSHSNKPIIQYTSDAGQDWLPFTTKNIGSSLKLISTGNDGSLFAIDTFNKFWYSYGQGRVPSSSFKPLKVVLNGRVIVLDPCWHLEQVITTNQAHTEGIVTFVDSLEQQEGHSKNISYFFVIN